MSFRFSAEETRALAPSAMCIEDRRNNPVHNRKTRFRLMQQNILAYTYPFAPGFAEPGINTLPFDELISQALLNATLEGQLRFGSDFEVNSNATAKVAGDIFEKVEALVHWNAAARWNEYMVSGTWQNSPRYPRPTTSPDPNRQVVVLNLPRRYDWVRLLTRDRQADVEALRAELLVHDLTMPTSTPDLLVVRTPDHLLSSTLFRTELPSMDKKSQLVLDRAYVEVENSVPADAYLLAIAVKRSLRSDRLYQPLYEANVMQLILEGQLGAEQVDFEVHTLESVGTRAAHTYSAASLGLVASSHAKPHRAVRDLYEPPTADAMVRRFLRFLDYRVGTNPSP